MRTLTQGVGATWTRAAAVGCVAATVIAAHCNRTMPAPMAGGRPDCPHDVSIPVDSHRVVTTIPLAGPTSNVPEYHDCQRLLEGSSSTYGPLVGIWASATLPRLAESLQVRMQTSRAPVAIAVAELYNWDAGYIPLGIEPQFNCLYMAKDPGTGDWVAWMVPAGTDEQRCMRDFDPNEMSATATQLAVTPVRPAGPLAPVARWDWSGSPRTQYIGIACDAMWCEVGPMTGFTGSPGHSATELAEVPPVDINGRRRIAEVKPWFDEQRLAPATGVPTSATALFGTVFPHEDLGAYTDASFSAGTWLPSAYVRFRGPSGDYATKYGFAGDGHVSVIALCRGDIATCLPARHPPNEVYRPTSCPPLMPGEEQWMASVVSRVGVTYLCVVRRPAPAGVRVPGTARWRWKASDETVWMRCVDGCCEVQPRG